MEILALHLNHQKPEKFQLVLEGDLERKDTNLSKGLEYSNMKVEEKRKRPLSEDIQSISKSIQSAKIQKLANQCGEETFPALLANRHFEERGCEISMSENEKEERFDILKQERKSEEGIIENVLESILNKVEIRINEETELEKIILNDAKIVVENLIQKCELDLSETPGDSNPSKGIIHGDYRVYKNNSSGMQGCAICSQDTSEPEDDEVSCSKCINVMHRECAGYNGLRVLQHECPSCAMREVR